ncbi:uncharacterized protein C2845_PM01G25700 [Panicum miliaceum]|uniref:Uncharacterized protein n=1 Tax=Panicum miliaceum TaxID=4540 RepID=A0A3L6TQQ6_PANMI|nr:uncharacterized protein C2845_PM01G25700 [Panicum miliaceum]
MAVDESFKRPGSIPFKWEVQPGIPKQEAPPATGDSTTAAPAPLRGWRSLRRLRGWRSLPPLASTVSSAPLSPPPSQHRRSMSARFATSLALPFTRRPRRGRAAKDDVDHCLLYTDKIA